MIAVTYVIIKLLSRRKIVQRTSLELDRSCPAQLAVLDNLHLLSRFLQGGKSKEYMKATCTRIPDASSNSSSIYSTY